MAFEDFLHPLLERYFSSPQWVKNTVGAAYSVMAPIARGALTRRYAEEAVVADEDVTRHLSTVKLQRTLRCALETVPAYRPHAHLLRDLAKPLDVLAQLPIMTKETIRHNLADFMSTQTPPRHRLRVSTGGSTSVPMVFYLHKGISRSKEYGYIDAFHRRAGMNRDDIALALRGRTVPAAARGNGGLCMYEPIKKQLHVSSDHLDRASMPAYLQAIRKWKPAFVQAFPSTIYPLARWLQEHPAPDISAQIRGIMLFSENVLDHHRTLLADVFDCCVLRHYGQSERILMAASMPDDDRYFFFPQYGHFELIDERGSPITRPGVMGEIVGTAFDNAVLPFIRYRTGDMATLGVRPHPLLPGYPVVETIEGRRQEFIVCNDRRLITVNSLTTPGFDDLDGVEDVQFEQLVPGHFAIRVVTPRPLTAEARRRIVRALQEKTQGGCSAEVVEVDRIGRTARGKHRMLIQHLDLTGYFGANASGPVAAKP